MIQKIQTDLSVAFSPSQRKLKPYILKDLKNFGDKIDFDEITFRWPTAEDLTKLGLREPLKLKKIRTKGVQGDDLTAI